MLRPETVARISRHKEGFRVNETTGQADKREYSSFIAHAEKLLQHMRALEAVMQQRENHELPGRADKTATTLNEMQAELQACYEEIKHWRTTGQRRIELMNYIRQLAEELAAAEQHLELPRLTCEIHALEDRIEALVSRDESDEMDLRDMRPEDMVAYDV